MPRYKVKHGRVSVRPGTIIETDDEVWARRYAARLELVSQELPEDFPGLEHLAEAGITTFQDLEGMLAEQLLELKGIGKVTAGAILKAVPT